MQFNWPNFNKEQERLANVKLSSKSSRDRLHTVMKYYTEGVLVMNHFLNAACNAITMWLVKCAHSALEVTRPYAHSFNMCRNSKLEKPDNYNWTIFAWGEWISDQSIDSKYQSHWHLFFGLELIPSSKLTNMVSFRYLVMVYIREDKFFGSPLTSHKGVSEE